MVREKMVRGKMVPGKKIAGKMVPEKLVPGKLVFGKNVVQKLFSIKRMLVNLNDFLFLSTDSTTHTKICLTFTSRSYMHQTVEH